VASEPALALPLVAVVGATGTGKSAFALSLVEALAQASQGAEIINADAMQLYRGMNIGTAKLPLEERRGITHHLLDVWDVSMEASVAGYQRLARATIYEVLSRGVIPILVGGSGLYVSSVLYEFDFPGTDPKIRATLEARLATEGTAVLQGELAAKDPLAAAAIDPKNSRRLIRALEVIELTGKPFGAGLDAERHPWRANTHLLGLARAREELIVDLDNRVLQMWELGLIDEVKSLIPQGIQSGVTASKAIGYQQALEVIGGETSEADAIMATQALTRRYARRQVSWFRRDETIRWLDPQDSASASASAALLLGA
jgi:tRNA dimethylallyltransferase